MKGLSKRRRMVFFFLDYLLSFQRYSSFCSKIDDVTNCISTKINHKILNISGNIEVMLLKLGTNNVCQVSNKLTPTLTLSWHYSWSQTLCCKPNISIFDQIRGGTQSYLKHTKCPYSLHLLTSSLVVNDV